MDKEDVVYIYNGTLPLLPSRLSRVRLTLCDLRDVICPVISLGQDVTVAAAAAAKPLQSCLTLCDPRDGSPPGSPIPGILQARTLEWVAISFSNA